MALRRRQARRTVVVARRRKAHLLGALRDLQARRLFCVSLGAISTSRIAYIRELGLGMIIAVAIDATIVRAILVPALMRLLGDWNWWAPRPLQILHTRLTAARGRGTEEPESRILDSMATRPAQCETRQSSRTTPAKPS